MYKCPNQKSVRIKGLIVPCGTERNEGDEMYKCPNQKSVRIKGLIVPCGTERNEKKEWVYCPLCVAGHIQDDQYPQFDTSNPIARLWDGDSD